ncbi:MAG: methyltransferase domain-containing protein [Mangrovicoccus sp.]
MTDFPKCRACGAPLELTLVDLGLSPLANSYVAPQTAPAEDPRYPLHARVCTSCWLVQVEDAVPAGEIFSADYAYFSSFSDSWLAHCKSYADKMTQRLGLGPDSLVIEIASNDGYLLQYFVAQEVPVLGVEPSAGVAAAAEEKGVSTIVDFFGRELARRLKADGHCPDLICSANVLAHVPDINDFVSGVATLLAADAIYTVEFPHLLNLIEKVQFDTIYHEHYSYLSLKAVEILFARHGLRVFDVEELPTHGGSLRVFACLEKASLAEGPGLAAMRAKETAAGLDDAAGYQGFAPRCEALRVGLIEYLQQAKTEGRKVAAYGAAAKGNTLLNYANIGENLIAYCVDRNPAKQGTLLPGSRIPVYAPEVLQSDRPDDLLILPWNIRDEVISQQADLAAQGTRFVTAVPKIEIF